MNHRAVLLLVVVVVGAGGCIPTLDLGPGSQLACEHDVDCPDHGRCLAIGLCAAADSPCITESGQPVADGTACGDNDVCTAGLCRERGCGDGVVDGAAGEACDPAADPRCRADCTLPVCGDGIVDAAESCDVTSQTCTQCVFLCATIDLDTGVVSRHSNCNLDVSDGCECDADIVRANGGEAVFQSAQTNDAIYFTTVSDGETQWSLHRFVDPGAGADPASGLATLVDRVTDVALAETDGVIYANISRSGELPSLARVDGDDVVTLRGGLNVFLGASFTVVDGRYFVADEEGLFTASADGDDGVVLYTPACTYTAPVLGCGGRIFCSSEETGATVSLDPHDPADQETIYSFDPANRAPQLLCHAGAVVVADAGTISSDRATLARFPSALSNFNARIANVPDSPDDVLVSEGIGAAGPFSYLFELGTGRLLPVSRGFVIGAGRGYVLTDDDATGAVALLRTQQ